MKYSFKTPLIGLEIESSCIKMVQVIREKKGWRLIRCKKAPIPPETLEFSHKDENIIDPHLFAHTIEDLLRDISGKVSHIGLSLPSECIKITTHLFEGPQDKKSVIRDLIAWKERATLPYPVEKAKISFCPYNPESMEERFFLVVIGFEDIIKDFEMNFSRLKISPKVIRPSIINHINFYMEHLSLTGITAFLGLFERYFTFFVFEDEQMVFYRGQRRSISYIHFIQEINMTIELFQNDHPGENIEKLYVGSQIGLTQDLEEELEEYSDIDITSIDAERIISLDQGLKSEGEKIDVWSYVSAIGAAQSLIA